MLKSVEAALKGDPIELGNKWLEWGLLTRMKSQYLRGEGELQESSSILYIFQIVVRP